MPRSLRNLVLFVRCVEALCGLTIVTIMGLFAWSIASQALAHEVGDGSGVVIDNAVSKVSVESMLVMNSAVAAIWPEGNGLATCVRTGLLSQKRSGTYAVKLYFDILSTATRASIVLTNGNGEIVTKYDTGYSNTLLLLKDYARLTSPAHPDFNKICGALTGTRIVFGKIN